MRWECNLTVWVIFQSSNFDPVTFEYVMLLMLFSYFLVPSLRFSLCFDWFDRTSCQSLRIFGITFYPTNNVVADFTLKAVFGGCESE